MPKDKNLKKKERLANFKAWLPEAILAAFARKKSPKNMEDLRAALIGALPDHLKKHKRDITNLRLAGEFRALYWKGREKLLRDASASGQVSAEKLYEVLELHNRRGEPLPPFWVVEEMYRDMQGRTKTAHGAIETLHGIHNFPIDEATPLTFTSTSFTAPFRALPDHAGDEFKLAFISSPQIGRPYDVDIYRNLTRSALSATRKMSCDAVVIAGGLFHLPLKKAAGLNRFLDSFTSGLKTNLKLIAREYYEEAKRIKESGELVPLFVTAVERFENVLDGLYKVAVRAGHRPECTAPIYVVYSEADFRFLVSMVAWKFGYEQKIRLLAAEAFTRFKRKIAEKASENLVHAKLVGGKRNIQQAQDTYDEARQEADDAAKVASRLRLSNLEDEQCQMAVNYARGYFTAKVEHYLPGAKVIGENEAYLTFGKNPKIIKIVSGGGSSPYDAEVGQYGPAQRKEEQATLTVIMHPQSLGPRQTAREDYKNGTMLVEPVMFVEAPMLLDKEPIVAKLGAARVNDPTLRKVFDKRFEAGMITVDLHNDRKPDVNFLRTEAVRALGVKNANRTPAKILWIEAPSDIHAGGKTRFPIWLRSGMPVGCVEATFELMTSYLDRHNGLAPVVMLVSADDPTQGNHIEGHNRLHVQQLSMAEIVEKGGQWRRNIDAIPDPALQIAGHERYERWLANQLRVRATDHYGAQLEEFGSGIIRPYGRHFKGVILKAHQSGVILKTVSDYTGSADSRDIGLVNFPTGNHGAKTVKNALFESKILRDALQNLLWNDPDLAKFGLSAKRFIAAPMSQDLTIGHGTIQVGEDGYQYGIDILGSPPSRTSWNDPLQGWPRTHLRRGNPSTMMGLKGNMVLHFTGDKHFLMEEIYLGDLWLMASPNPHTDAYGDKLGLPENNTGTTFLGVPTAGPDKGEIRVVHLTPSLIQEYITSGKEFPWEEVLPHSI